MSTSHHVLETGTVETLLNNNFDHHRIYFRGSTMATTGWGHKMHLPLGGCKPTRWDVKSLSRYYFEDVLVFKKSYESIGTRPLAPGFLFLVTQFLQYTQFLHMWGKTARTPLQNLLIDGWHCPSHCTPPWHAQPTSSHPHVPTHVGHRTWIIICVSQKIII